MPRLRSRFGVDTIVSGALRGTHGGNAGAAASGAVSARRGAAPASGVSTVAAVIDASFETQGSGRRHPTMTI
jgi:hypothetical protein